MLTRNIQQDCIENFFSSIRMKGGFCRNPTASQFRLNFRYLFFSRFIKLAGNGNTGEMDTSFGDESLTLSLINPTPSESGEVSSGANREGGTASSEVIPKSCAEWFYATKVGRRLLLGNLQENTVACYIGAAIVKAILVKTKCRSCSSLLVDRSEILNYNLTNCSNRF